MPDYESYMLRVWRSRRREGREWALRLEHLQGGERWQFDDPEALAEALRALLDAEPPSEPGSPEHTKGEEQERHGLK